MGFVERPRSFGFPIFFENLASEILAFFGFLNNALWR